MSETILLEAHNLARHYHIGGGLFAKPTIVQALDGASFTLSHKETLAVVGESGCGKSTLARLLTMIEPPSSGSLAVTGIDVPTANPEQKKDIRRMVQIVFQDPYGSLNPRQKVGTILGEPLKINTDMTAEERRKAALEMMDRVGLRPEHYNRYPHMFSGGQRQRIAVARALMLRPRILILDEPVSALDVSIRAQVLNLLADLQEEFGLSYLFISHDLSVVQNFADNILVMYLGRVVERGSCADIFTNPHHPYTQALLSATPRAEPGRKKNRVKLTGELPSPIDPPSGCPFHPRCPAKMDICSQTFPEERIYTPTHRAACHMNTPSTFFESGV